MPSSQTKHLWRVLSLLVSVYVAGPPRAVLVIEVPPLVEAVERAAGLTLFSDAIKGGSKHICKTAKCQVIVRRFDDAQKRPELRRTVSAPR